MKPASTSKPSRTKINHTAGKKIRASAPLSDRIFFTLSVAEGLTLSEVEGLTLCEVEGINFCSLSGVEGRKNLSLSS
jgi:hypothetical protein